MEKSIAETPYEELEEQWEMMLHKFARWRIGIDHSDLFQEMRVVLFTAQQNYDPTKGAAFCTYLFRALLNKIRKIDHFNNRVKKRISTKNISSLDQMTSVQAGLDPEIFDDLDTVELLSSAPVEVKMVAKLLLAGCAKDELPRFIKADIIETGMSGLKELLAPQS